MSIVFADVSKLTAAACKLARAQAEFDAAVEKCNKFMLPLSATLQDANQAFKEICVQTAKDEQAGLNPDLNQLFVAAVENEQKEVALLASNEGLPN